MLAADLGIITMTRRLLERGANVHAITLVSVLYVNIAYGKQRGWTALMFAVSYACKEPTGVAIISLLVSYNSEINHLTHDKVILQTTCIYDVSGVDISTAFRCIPWCCSRHALATRLFLNTNRHSKQCNWTYCMYCDEDRICKHH